MYLRVIFKRDRRQEVKLAANVAVAGTVMQPAPAYESQKRKLDKKRSQTCYQCL